MGIFGPFLMVRLCLYSVALLAGYVGLAAALTRMMTLVRHRLFSGLVIVLSRRREHQTAIPAKQRSSEPPTNPFGINAVRPQK